MNDRQLLQNMVSRLNEALDRALLSVVLYGPGARRDLHAAGGHLNLMIVCADLEPATLKALSSPVRWWLGKAQPWPRLFSQMLIRDSLDVFPVEFLDLSQHRTVLFGEDPIGNIKLDQSHLRLQCERDLREKVMRLREGFVECGGAARALHRLLTASHTSFAPLWRASLQLLGSPVPKDESDAEVVARLSRRLGIAGTALEEVALLAEGAHSKAPDDLFVRYLHQLNDTITCIDQLVIGQKESTL